MSSRFSSAVLALVMVVAACGEPAPPPAPDNPNAKPVDTATAGAVSGQVTFTGTPPAAETIRMGTDAACVQGSGPNPVSNAVLVGNGGSLQNVFVYIKDGLDPDYRFDVPADPAILDQRGCFYLPRVVGVMVGQTLEIRNSDPTMHNVHALPMTNLEFNRSTPVQGSSTTHIFTMPEVMVRFMCNVHSWMAAWVGVAPRSSANNRSWLNSVPPAPALAACRPAAAPDATRQPFARRTQYLQTNPAVA
jgi:hypothetical protein